MTAWGDLLNHPFWLRLGIVLTHFLWQGFAVAVLTWCVVRLLVPQTCRARYAAYLAGLGVMIGMPVVTFLFVTFPVRETRVESKIPAPVVSGSLAETSGSSVGGVPTEPVTPADEPAVRHASTGAEDTAWMEEVSDSGERTGARSGPLVTWQHRSLAWGRAALPWFPVVWLTGVTVLSLRLLIGYLAICRWRRTLEPLPPRCADLMAELAKRLGLEGFARIFGSSHVAEPIAIGFLRPMVLIPLSMLTHMSPELLEAVVAHELAHIRRYDLWINLLQRVVETLLFYHPAVWWLSARVRYERELCCDDLAIEMTGERAVYAKALEAVGRSHSCRPALLATGIRTSNGHLVSRIRRILGVTSDSDTKTSWLAGAFGLLLLAVATATVTGVLGEGRLTSMKVDEELAEESDRFQEPTAEVAAVKRFSGAVPVTDLAQGLVAEYTFDDTTADNPLYSESGVGHGVAVGTPLFEPRGAGMAAHVTQGNFFRVPAAEAFVPGADSWTIAVDFRVETLRIPRTDNQARLFTLQGGDYAEAVTLCLGYMEEPVAIINVHPDTRWCPTPAVISLFSGFGQWHTMAAVALAEPHGTRLHAYLDGRLVGITTYTGSIDPTWDMLIGAYDYESARNGNERFVTGDLLIDNVRIWERALSKEEVRSVDSHVSLAKVRLGSQGANEGAGELPSEAVAVPGVTPRLGDSVPREAEPVDKTVSDDRFYPLYEASRYQEWVLPDHGNELAVCGTIPLDDRTRVNVTVLRPNGTKPRMLVAVNDDTDFTDSPLLPLRTTQVDVERDVVEQESEQEVRFSIAYPNVRRTYRVSLGCTWKQGRYYVVRHRPKGYRRLAPEMGIIEAMAPKHDYESPDVAAADIVSAPPERGAGADTVLQTAQLRSGLVTLRDGDSYSFRTQQYASSVGGDFCYRVSEEGPLFYANQRGQDGLIDLGLDADLSLASLDPPSGKYNRFGVRAEVGHVYVSRADNGDEIAFRVTRLEPDGELELDYLCRDVPDGSPGADNASRVASIVTGERN